MAVPSNITRILKSKGDARRRVYRQIIATLSDAVAIVDRTWKHVERNDAHRALFGYPDRKFFRLDLKELLGRTAFESTTRELLERGYFRGELSFRGPTGRAIRVESVFFPVRDNKGKPFGFAACHRDLGPGHRDEERLRRTTDELRFQKSVLESQSEASPDGILVVSPDGLILSSNRRFAEMWGIPAEIVRRGSDEAALEFVMSSLARPREFIAQVRKLYRRPRDESRDEILLKDGRVFDRFSAPVLGEDGSILGRVWYFRDATRERRSEAEQRRLAEEAQRALAELKRAQSRLIRSEKLALMGMLVSGVAHEINNPINVVYGNLKLLRERCDQVTELAARSAPPDARKFLGDLPDMLKDALRAAESAREVIREFRNFARDPNAAEPTDLNACVDETLAVVRKELAGVRVRRRTGKIPPVRAFHGQMNQVLLNLVQNAIEAMKGKGTLTIATATAGKRVRVTVSDTGPGIPSSDHERIFDPFYTTKEGGAGMGLGLSISATIVQNHGGHLTVTSRPGQGATFLVDLPAG